MKKSILILFSIVCSSLYSQVNLVLNPSFEVYITPSCSQAGPYYTIPPWGTPSSGSPDYFITCLPYPLSAPQNLFGYQFPRTGNAYMGLFTNLQQAGNHDREYLQGKLSDSLRRNKIYCATFYVSLGIPPPSQEDFSTVSITKIGAYFSHDSISMPSVYDLLPFTPQVESLAGVFYSDTINWVAVSGQFIAQGGERFFNIGNFNSVYDTLRIANYNPIYTWAAHYYGSYYFIDDVSLTECGSVLPPQTACGSYTLHNQTYTSSGTYTQIIPSFYGGDSTLMLNLTILDTTGSTLAQTACNSYTYNSTTYTHSGSYTQHFTAYNGCDSALTLNLTINNDATNAFTTSACNSYTLSGNTYTNSGIYTNHYNTFRGCDSAFTLNLTIYNDTNNTITTNACNSYTLSGNTYTTSGIYTNHYSTFRGCDSTITLNLTIDSINTAVNNMGDTLTATSNGTYQWVNCTAGFTPIANAINQTYIATANGDYAVIITNGSCMDTSNCYTVFTVGIDQLTINNEELIIYPNPSANKLQVKSSKVKIQFIKVIDLLGKCIADYTNIDTYSYELDIDTMPKGVYIIEVTTRYGIIRKKFVKQ